MLIRPNEIVQPGDLCQNLCHLLSLPKYFICSLDTGDYSITKESSYQFQIIRNFTELCVESTLKTVETMKKVWLGQN